MPKALSILSPFHNLSAGDLADEHGQLCAQIADLESRKRTIAGELIRRGVSEVEGALFRSLVVAETMVSTLDRQGIEKAMGEAWIARFLKFSKRSAFVKTTVRTGAVPMGHREGATMTKPHHSENQHAAGLYRAMALRFYARYVDMRGHAAFAGGDFADHGPLPTERDAEARYTAAIEEWLFEPAASMDAVLALVELAGVIAADRLVGEITRDPVNDERAAFHQVIALAAAGGWLNDVVTKEWLGRAKDRKTGDADADRAVAERIAGILRETKAALNEDDQGGEK